MKELEQYEPWETERWTRIEKNKNRYGFIMIELFYILQDFVIHFILAFSKNTVRQSSRRRIFLKTISFEYELMIKFFTRT